MVTLNIVCVLRPWVQSSVIEMLLDENDAVESEEVVSEEVYGSSTDTASHIQPDHNV